MEEKEMINFVLSIGFLIFGIFMFIINQTINEVPANLVNFTLFVSTIVSLVIAGFIIDKF